ncbi:site-specific integrase [Bacteroides caecimuris]|uniref:tyrosine-type recombinase/integrase n=1 Tax=Bacteroides caecimuris TaxID=1796613 RepID=UPI0026F0605D|nr:site-specific integrase [Bacteroides caecimuris]
MQPTIDLQQLQALLQCDTLDMCNVLDIIMARKRERIKKLHAYAITPANSHNKYWTTYFKCENKARQLIRGKTEDELLDKLVKLYEENANLDNLTFNRLFDEWLEYKKAMTNSSNTIKRHRQHYAKYFEPSILHSMKLSAIDTFVLEMECNRIVKEFNLTRKAWVNAKTILNGMFDYAKRKKYITDNPLMDMKITVRYKQVVKKSGNTQTYDTDELETLNKYLDMKYEETNDSVYIAVRLNFFLGLRIGELAALKPEDIVGNQIHVVREEVRDQEANLTYVVEHTKTNRDRFVALVPQAKKLLQKLGMDGAYLFERNGERLRARQIEYVLEKYAQCQGIEPKRSHKIRKTYASRLNAFGVPIDAIREQLGHSELSTTLSYIYNPLTEDATYSMISDALDGKKVT